MADFVNPVTCDLVASADSMPSPWIVCTRANFTAWSAIAFIYRKWVTDHIEEMTAGEKTTKDAAIESSKQTQLLVQYDRKDLPRATLLVSVDEINALRQWIESFKAATAAATSLSDLKTRVAALSAMPDRTTAQAKTAITNKLATMNGS